jgi:hypothetical protein
MSKENQSLKDRALRALRDVATLKIKDAKNFLQKEGFKEMPDGSCEIEIDGETIKWIPSVSISTTVARSLITKICDATSLNSKKKERKAWEELHEELGLPHAPKKIISPGSSRELFNLFTEEIHNNRYMPPFVIKKISKGIEALIPYMQLSNENENEFDPCKEYEKFRQEFPLPELQPA